MKLINKKLFNLVEYQKRTMEKIMQKKGLRLLDSLSDGDDHRFSRSTTFFC